jgi:hypothetical protein
VKGGAFQVWEGADWGGRAAPAGEAQPQPQPQPQPQAQPQPQPQELKKAADGERGKVGAAPRRRATAGGRWQQGAVVGRAAGAPGPRRAQRDQPRKRRQPTTPFPRKRGQPLAKATPLPAHRPPNPPNHTIESQGPITLSTYPKRLETSWVWSELRRERNIRPGFRWAG